MAVRDDFTAGEVLSAADLNDTFASKLPYSYGTATPSTTDSGFLWYDSNSTPAAPKFWDGSAFQALTSGKILQIVRATDSTLRSTTSTSFVDANMSITITPQKSDSAIIIVLNANYRVSTSTNSEVRGIVQITDASNNTISGAEQIEANANGFTASGFRLIGGRFAVLAYDTPATTSATTYKVRFRSVTNTGIDLRNADATGQMYAIEVSA